MKNLVNALLVIFIIILTTQFLHLAYDRVFYSRVSVIDKFNNKKAGPVIDPALSLKELSMIYADAEKRIRVFEDDKSAKELARYDRTDEPYARKVRIMEIITSRESDYRMIREIIIYWIAGLLLIAGGSVVYRKFEIWIGAALVISGFIQMIWKTGPVLFLTGDVTESLLILNVKLIFSAVTLAAVIAAWIFGRKFIAK